MRILLVAFLVIIPVILSFALRAITGDQMSALGLGLIIFVTVAAWFGGRPLAASELKKW